MWQYQLNSLRKFVDGLDRFQINPTWFENIASHMVYFSKSKFRRKFLNTKLVPSFVLKHYTISWREFKEGIGNKWFGLYFRSSQHELYGILNIAVGHMFLK